MNGYCLPESWPEAEEFCVLPPTEARPACAVPKRFSPAVSLALFYDDCGRLSSVLIFFLIALPRTCCILDVELPFWSPLDTPDTFIELFNILFIF